MIEEHCTKILPASLTQDAAVPEIPSMTMTTGRGRKEDEEALACERSRIDTPYRTEQEPRSNQISLFHFGCPNLEDAAGCP